ncbi:hypothetical protein NKJ06_34610 [Mesorhizobium sp. M0293]|uniref:hypothetical protein n=1 Tax=Mesorhizobium sp. M0293 TaxID=2956930 RepID=UPI003334F67B
MSGSAGRLGKAIEGLTDPNCVAISALVYGDLLRISFPHAHSDSLASAGAHNRWLTAQKFGHSAQQDVFEDQVDAVTDAQRRLGSMDRLAEQVPRLGRS